MRELVTEPIVMGAIILAVTTFINKVFEYFAKRNPEQDAWDRLYAISDRVVHFIEKNERQISYGTKLSTDDKIKLRNKAIGEVIKYIDPKLKKYIAKNTDSGNEFRKVIAQVVEHSVERMKQKYK
jgi:hypothetical protein